MEQQEPIPQDIFKMNLIWEWILFESVGVTWYNYIGLVTHPLKVWLKWVYIAGKTVILLEIIMNFVSTIFIKKILLIQLTNSLVFT